MEFEFDPAKSELNCHNRGFGFAFAAQVFFGRTLEGAARNVDGEVRVKAIGQIEELCYVVIFSARRANRKETRAWHASA